MRKMIVHGFTALALGAGLAIGLGMHAQAAAPANYSRACTDVVASNSVASNGFVEKAVYARRAVRRTARRTARRHHY
jgi:F0F1-type ATP synthase membrane subunit c/vacuolar-type H+-ATPase subunit K